MQPNILESLMWSTSYSYSPSIVTGSGGSHGTAMAYMSHGRADAESLLDFMDSRRRPTSEILTIFLGQPTSAESGGGCRI